MNQQKTKENIQDIYPLSPMQQGMLFHSLLEPNSGAYIVQITYKIDGDININAFTQAWQQLVERHDILRTVFAWNNLEQPLQVVAKKIDIKLKQEDWQHLSDSEQKDKLDSFLQEQKTLGFNLNKVPLMRLHLIKLEERAYQFIWTYHHIILDGWSVPLLIKELLNYYQAYSQKLDISLTPTTPYKSYITWLQQQSQEAAKSFWQNELKGFTTPTTLKVKQHNIKNKTSNNYQEQILQLPAEISHKLQSLSKEYGLTLNTIIQGAWAILLERYSGEGDIIFGATCSGRPTSLDNVQSMVGLFINTLPVRVKIDPQQDLLAFLKQLQARQLERQEYEYSSLIDIHRVSELSPEIPLFNSIVIFENYPVESSLKNTLDTLSIYDFNISEQTNYPLTLYATLDSNLSFKLLYNASIYDRSTISNLLQHLATLLAQISSNHQQKVGDLEILTTTEKQQLLVNLNCTEKDYPQDICFTQLFEEQVTKTPNAIAAIFESEQITYQDLDSRSNLLASYLQEKGVSRETFVGIFCDRSLEMLVGLLAILKAGGTYIPLDPNYPQERINYIIEDSKLQFLLTESKYKSNFVDKNLTVIYLEKGECHSQGAVSGGNLQSLYAPPLHHPCTPAPNNLAYIIYTSGSTGKPKGVKITHRSLVNFLFSMQEKPGITANDILLAITTISFDIAALELYLPLLVGGKVVIAPDNAVQNSQELSRKIDEHNVTLMQATPTTWEMLIASNWQGNKQLKVLSGGEALSYSLAKELEQKTKEVWNLYGPTEATIWSSCYQFNPEENYNSNTVSIGKPIANTQFYILDNRHRLVPPGVAGELYIGGAGLARGYLNRPQLTAERFINCATHLGKKIPPQSPRNSGGRKNRLYKTGDRARQLPDGNIEYLERIDDLIKLRGFRIELGEIETVLEQHPEVEKAIASVQELNGEKKIVAYILPHKKQDDLVKINNSQYRNFLIEKLPLYMIPSDYILLEKIPLTPNNKIDRNALPKLDESRPELAVTYRVPQTNLEKQIAAIWQEVLQLDKVGVTDNFFELGGHSLLIVRVHQKIQQLLATDIELVDMFRYPTIASLAQYLNQNNNQKQAIISTEQKTQLSTGKNRLQQRRNKRKTINK